MFFLLQVLPSGKGAGKADRDARAIIIFAIHEQIGGPIQRGLSHNLLIILGSRSLLEQAVGRRALRTFSLSPDYPGSSEADGASANFFRATTAKPPWHGKPAGIYALRK
ncbi:MAG: hypothetical protein KDJ90_20435 [Nitratireductor sp.]|nr:hypothetical protein [Nitratireductor sp.]